MNQATCPQRDHIARYILGTLDEQTMEQVAQHLAGCPECQAAADDLESASDPLIETLRSPQPECPHGSEPQCRHALDRLTDLRRKFPWLFQPGAPESPADDEWDLPQILGEYLVLARIGGHQGDVYKAFHLELERLVALKMLPRNLLADEAAAERFRREIKAIGRLDHPNIVRAHDAREIAGRRFLVMEYVDGRDLDELVRLENPLRIADACEMVRQAAVALQYVHQHGLVHRDVKPANLMLARDARVRLLDLGLARFRVHRPADGQATGPGLAVGTADYMAPEQASNSHEVDIRADIYSLGCTLYKLLAGRAPFETADCESTLDKLSAHLKQPVPPIRQLRPDVPDGLAAVVHRMLAKNPAERFDTPGEVAAAVAPFAVGADLAALVHGRQIDEDPNKRQEDNEGPQPPPTRPSNRWFWELATIAATVLVVLGVTMAVARLGPFGNRSAETVAHFNPARTDAQPEEAPEAEGDESVGQPPPPESDVERPRPAAPSSPGAETARQPAVSSPEAKLDVDNPSTPPTGTPRSGLRIELDDPDGIYHGPPMGPDGNGELIRVTITAEQSGHLYLLMDQPDGTLLCLLPSGYQAANKIEPGRPVTVLDPESDFELQAGPPYGVGVLVALVSREPLAPSRFGVASLTDQPFTAVDRKAVEQLRAEIKANADVGSEVEMKLTIEPGEPQPSEGPEPPRPREVPEPTAPPPADGDTPEPTAPPPPEQAPESPPAPDESPEATRPSQPNRLDRHPASPVLMAIAAAAPTRTPALAAPTGDVNRLDAQCSGLMHAGKCADVSRGRVRCGKTASLFFSQQRSSGQRT